MFENIIKKGGLIIKNPKLGENNLIMGFCGMKPTDSLFDDYETAAEDIFKGLENTKLSEFDNIGGKYSDKMTELLRKVSTYLAKKEEIDTIYFNGKLESNYVQIRARQLVAGIEEPAS